MQIVDENDEILEPALRPMCVQRFYIYDASIFDAHTNRQTDGQPFSGLPFEAAWFYNILCQTAANYFPVTKTISSNNQSRTRHQSRIRVEPTAMKPPYVPDSTP